MKKLLIALTALVLVGCGDDRPVYVDPVEPVYVERAPQVVHVDNSRNVVTDALVTGMIINAMTSNDNDYDRRPVHNTTVVNKTVVVNNKKTVKPVKVKKKPKPAKKKYVAPKPKKVKKTSFASKSSYSKTKKHK